MFQHNKFEVKNGNVDIGSVITDITITDDFGNEITKFRDPITICLEAPKDDKVNFIFFPFFFCISNFFHFRIIVWAFLILLLILGFVKMNVLKNLTV